MITLLPPPPLGSGYMINMPPPLPARTAFICFSDSAKGTIAQELGISAESQGILKLTANAWNRLSRHEKMNWDEAARLDKTRHFLEKASHKKFAQVIQKNRRTRTKKDTLAPKRPMSAFLMYSHTKRAYAKKENPDMTNTDVSRLLGEMWRNAPPHEKDPFVEQEEIARAGYKITIANFKAEQSRIKTASRTISDNGIDPRSTAYSSQVQSVESIFRRPPDSPLPGDKDTSHHGQRHHPNSLEMFPSLVNSFSFTGTFDDALEISHDPYLHF